jgi:hypothetical protein
MTNSQCRALAIVLQQRIDDLYTRLLPVYTLSHAWKLNLTDGYLPAPGQVKQVFDTYTGFSIYDISLADILLELYRIETTEPHVFVWTLDPLVVFTLDPLIVF